MSNSKEGPRIILFGNRELACRSLEWLVNRGENVVSVFGVPKDPNEGLYESVVDLAHEREILTCRPENVNSGASVDLILSLHPDLILSIAYRQILGKEILDTPRLGGVNFHPSLLPQYRGRAPINWAILNGETETGVTFHYMDEKSDTGDIITQERIQIGFRDTAQDLWEKASSIGFDMFKEIYLSIRNGTAPRISQEGKPSSYFGKRTPKDGEIDWSKPALQVYNLVRAVTRPFPGAFTYLDGENLYVWSSMPHENGRTLQTGKVYQSEGRLFVGTGSGTLELEEISFMGNNYSAKEFSREYNINGKILG